MDDGWRLSAAAVETVEQLVLPVSHPAAIGQDVDEAVSSSARPPAASPGQAV
jgi:hypothetical protein